MLPNSCCTVGYKWVIVMDVLYSGMENVIENVFKKTLLNGEK